MDSNSFYPHPRTYIGLEELYARVIFFLTGVSNARLIIMGEGRFCFEDVKNPDNPVFRSFIGIVDPQAEIDLDNIPSTTIFYVDDDYEGKVFIIATDGNHGLSVGLFYRIAKFYNL